MKRIIDMELEEQRENMSPIERAVNQTIAGELQQVYNLLASKQAISNHFCKLNGDNFVNVDSELVNIVEYVKGEMVVLETSLFPPNLFLKESYFYHPDIKSRIKHAIKDKLFTLKETNINGEITDVWSNAILIFEINKLGKTNDLDNYFMKPYIDGVTLSRFIKDDNYNNLKLVYTPFKSDKQMIRMTLINLEFFNKYENIFWNIIKE